MIKSSLTNQKTWLSYLHTLKDKCIGQDQPELTGFDEFFTVNSMANSFFKHSIPYVYLLDYKRGAYMNMSDNFGGYKAECFLRNGLNHTLEIYHPDHLTLFDRQIFPARLHILKGIPVHEHRNYIFSYNFCIRNRKGGYEEFLQRNCFLSDNDGDPIFSIGILINVNKHQYENKVVQTVDYIDGSGCSEHLQSLRAVYHLHQEDKLFTKREKEVIQWMADGLSSKMIAHKLHISENTIINHRRNMQEKSNMPNSTALVSYAIRNGII
jgi:DNA-binding CsgD family transcriptional regulator